MHGDLGLSTIIKTLLRLVVKPHKYNGVFRRLRPIVIEFLILQVKVPVLCSFVFGSDKSALKLYRIKVSPTLHSIEKDANIFPKLDVFTLRI